MTIITVDGESAYDVHVGAGVSSELASITTSVAPLAHTVVLVHPRSRPPGAVAAALAATGMRIATYCVPDGEAAKDVEVLQGIWALCAEVQLSRTDLLVGVGGGATTDVTGFAAATWLRGVGAIHVPTTILGMVDAAVGGKTGINTSAGKNLVGAFHAPLAVVCDLDLLHTLPRAELASGLAEVVKCGFIADPTILELIEPDPPAAVSADNPDLFELVTRAVQVKADVVSDDFRETGLREILNYGHTLGHAIEKAEQYSWRHGEAIAVGMCFAARLSRASGRLTDSSVVERHDEVLSGLGLPTRYSRQAWPQLLDSMRVDKKSRAGRLRFVVLDGVGHASVLDDVDRQMLADVYAEVST